MVLSFSVWILLNDGTLHYEIKTHDFIIYALDDFMFGKLFIGAVCTDVFDLGVIKASKLREIHEEVNVVGNLP
jgi:hypothetical protein